MAENGNGNRTRALLRVLVIAVLGYFGQRFVAELDERDAENKQAIKALSDDVKEIHKEVANVRADVQLVLIQHRVMLDNKKQERR